MTELTISNKRWIRRIHRPAVFLTYDDGPNPSVTPQLLDLLKEEGVPATFFVTGDSLNQTEAPAILRRMLAEGHTVGNHGQLHLKTEYPDYELSQAGIEAACGLHTRLFRAPHGLKTHVAEYLRRDRNVLAVHWTMFFEDWLPVDMEKFGKQISNLEPGAILLLHDGSTRQDEYKDRSQVVALTKMILSECRRRSIPLAGLASVYPALHRIRSDAERARDRRRANRSFSFVKSISATLSTFKQWSGSHWM